MKNRQSGCSALVWIVLIALLLFSGGMALNILTAIPTKAQTLYGPPSNLLSSSQQMLLGYQLVKEQEQLTTPSNPNGEPFEFTIEQDETVDAILQRMKTVGLIADVEPVRNYLIYTGLDTQIQAGKFTLSPAQSPIEIVATLLDATPREATVVILAGWRLEEIAASIETTGLDISQDEFITAARQHSYSPAIIQEIPNPSSLEGFFPPGIYQVDRSLDSGQLIEVLLNEFENILTYDIREGIEQQGLTLYEGVVLASIIEREAMLEEEMPIIASVFFNRLAAGMKLETDPTVQYAVGYNDGQGTWWTNPLTITDLQTDSPYNTYLYPGLPPSPIANPSTSALQAVAFPAQTPYYYFRAACDDSGRHNFSQTYEEHLSNACQ